MSIESISAGSGSYAARKVTATVSSSGSADASSRTGDSSSRSVETERIRAQSERYSTAEVTSSGQVQQMLMTLQSMNRI